MPRLGSTRLSEDTLGAVTYVRFAYTHSAPIESDATRTNSVSRTSETYSETTESDASRTATVGRVASGYVSAVETDSDIIIDFVRTAESYSDTVESDATRTADVDRTAETFVPAVFEEEELRLGDARLGSGRLGGEEVHGIRTNSTRTLTFYGLAETYMERVDSEATRTASVARQSETWADTAEGTSDVIIDFTRTATGFSEPSETIADRTASVGRVSETWVAPIEAEAVRREGRLSETWVDTIETEADTSIEVWRFNGDQVKEVMQEIRNWQELSLTFRANEFVTKNRLRPLDTSTGKFEIVQRSDGSYAGISRASDKNIVDVVPPDQRSDLRVVSEYIVDEYNEEYVDQAADIYEVEVNLVATGPKSGGSYGDVTASDDQWKFEFADGSVATDRVEKDVGTTGGIVEGTKSISFVLERDELKVLEDSLNRQAAIYQQKVPDEQDLFKDKNDAGRNTVTVTAPPNRDPDEKVIESGDYVVSEWEDELVNNEFFQVSMTLAPKG